MMLIYKSVFMNGSISQMLLLSRYSFNFICPSICVPFSTTSIFGKVNKYSPHETIEGMDTDGIKKLTIRRTKPEGLVSPKPGHWNVVAYSTAAHYDIRNLREALLTQGVYIPMDLGNTDPAQSVTSNSIFADAKYKVTEEDRCLFYFQEGSVVMWNFDKIEQIAILSFLEPFECQSYRKNVVKAELENMSYTYFSHSKRSYINEGVIHIAADSKDKSIVNLDKYTFSNAMALSVKLGIFESTLEDYVHGIEFLTEDLKCGRKIRISRREVLRKSGELFALRHAINLSTDLLDTPDFYWDRDNLEALYQQAYSYFSISRRTKVLNEKLNHCIELLDLVSSHLSDRHHVRLEWMIIVLIMVEVAFEFAHYFNVKT